MADKIRMIARLDVKDTNLVKGIQMEGLRKLGDPNQFAKQYYEQGIDELLYKSVKVLLSQYGADVVFTLESLCLLLYLFSKLFVHLNNLSLLI